MINLRHLKTSVGKTVNDCCFFIGKRLVGIFKNKVGKHNIWWIDV